MSKALADLLESALDAWYGSVAGWNPPGRWTVQQCSTCRESPFTAAAGIDAWPHELAHELVGRLDGVVNLLRESIEEFDVQLAIGGRGLRDTVTRREAIAGHAEAAVLQALAGHEPAIRDVLEQCVGRRLDEFLSAEADRVIASLR